MPWPESAAVVASIFAHAEGHPPGLPVADHEHVAFAVGAVLHGFEKRLLLTFKRSAPEPVTMSSSDMPRDFSRIAPSGPVALQADDATGFADAAFRWRE